MRQFSLPTTVAYILGPVLIMASHLGSLILLKTGLSWGAAGWMVGLYLSRMLATTAIYHRLLTHRSYQAPKPILWLGSVVAASAGQMGPSWWKAHHLSHHQYVDQPLDPHSPLSPVQGWRGFWWSQAGWLLSPQFFPAKLPPDVEKDGVMWLIDRLHFVPVLALAALSYGLGGWEYLGAFCLSTTLLFHGVQTVNSISHLLGDQPFVTDDHSRNNRFVAWITLGEGWHNLHHAFPVSGRHGLTVQAGRVQYLLDPTYSFIKGLEALGWATRLRQPTEAELLAKASPAKTPAKLGVS